jgi:hypothetical protein
MHRTDVAVVNVIAQLRTDPGILRELQHGLVIGVVIAGKVAQRITKGVFSLKNTQLYEKR